ncbi:MAG: AraC family transcriptional regulator, partial [Clostridia bacterium]
NERLYMAMEMLKNSKKTIAEIASTVGIPDYNYLSKLIQKKTGMSPTKYRKSENIAKLTE